MSGSKISNETIDNIQSNNEIRQYIIVTYSILLLVSLFVYLTRTYGYFAMCLKIALKIHNNLFDGISRATMNFFNTNPSGRILNRFAKDINVVDSTLPATFLDVLSVRFYQISLYTLSLFIKHNFIDFYGYRWSFHYCLCC